MKLLHILSLTLLLSTASFGYANERTAGGNLSDQASWSALQNLINKNSSELAITKIDIAAMKACMAQGMLYGPGPDADEKGCRSVGGNGIINVMASGGAKIKNIEGIKSWPDYIVCPTSNMLYTLFLVRYGETSVGPSHQVIYQGTNSYLNQYFNTNGTYAGAANLETKCGTTDGHISSICKKGMCGYF